jgi:hypothetical protein
VEYFCEHGMNLQFPNKSGDCFEYMSGYLGSEELCSISLFHWISQCKSDVKADFKITITFSTPMQILTLNANGLSPTTIIISSSHFQQ